MKWIKISSKGLLQERYFTLLGASTKREAEGKIGYFGSGLKYSLAYLLRNEVPFKIFIGDREVVISTTDEKIGENEFKTICINGKQSDITTDFGPKWKAWMIVREFYSNAIDEGDERFEVVDEIVSDPERTCIYLDMFHFQNVFDKYNEYFAFKRKVVDTFNYEARSNYGREGSKIINVKILYKQEKTPMIIYRRGFRIYESGTNSVFDYDVQFAEINEERLASEEYILKCDIMTALLNSQRLYDIDFSSNEKCYETILISNGYFEDAYIDLEHYKNHIGDKVLIPLEAKEFYYDTPGFVVPVKLLYILREKYGMRTVLGADRDTMYKEPTKAEMDEFPTDKFLDSVRICKKYLKDTFEEFRFPEIKIVVFKDDGTMGAVIGDNKIAISVTLRTVTNMVDVILEECFHKQSGFGDKTREFQNFLMKNLTQLVINIYDYEKR